MHHRMPLSKTGWPSLNMVIFPQDHSPGRPKTVITPEIIDQIHNLILEDCCISAKSISEQLGISREWVGSVIHEDLDMRKLSAKWVPKMPESGSKTSTVPIVWASFGIVLVRSKWFPVMIGDHGWNLVITLWPGDKATINGVAAKRLTPPQKIPSANICWKSSRLDFLGSRRHPPHWLSSKGPNYQHRVLLISAGAIEGLLKEKCCGKFTKGVLFLHDNAPAHRAFATQKKLAYLGFQCLDHPPYSLDLAPLD